MYIHMGVLFISCSECDEYNCDCFCFCFLIGEYNCDCLFSLSHRWVAHPIKGIGFSIDCKNPFLTFIDKM